MESNPDQIIAAAMSFPMGRVLDRYMLTYSVSLAEATAQERELKRFLALCAIGQGKARYGIGKPVDELWHEFILFTRDYANFCNAVAGRFIHHKSRMPGITWAEADVVAMHQAFLSDYESAYGQPAPKEYWKPMHECSHVDPEPER